MLHATNNTSAQSVSPKRLSRQHAYGPRCSRTFQRIGCRTNPGCWRSTRGSFQLPFHAGFARYRRIERPQQRGCFYGFQPSIQKLQSSCCSLGAPVKLGQALRQRIVIHKAGASGGVREHGPWQLEEEWSAGRGPVSLLKPKNGSSIGIH